MGVFLEIKREAEIEGSGVEESKGGAPDSKCQYPTVKYR